VHWTEVELPDLLVMGYQTFFTTSSISLREHLINVISFNLGSKLDILLNVSDVSLCIVAHYLAVILSVVESNFSFSLLTVVQVFSYSEFG